MSRLPVRLIARLDVKGSNLIKGVHLEGLRVIGDPKEYATAYYRQGADELIYLDIVASLYGRSNLVDIVKRTASEIFIPLTVGGGVRTVEDASKLLKAGADKIAVNTAAVKNPKLISDISECFGSQCMVLSLEAKRNNDTWEVYTDCGRESTNIDAVDWVKEAVSLGAGEVLVTSIDREGTRKGYDHELLNQINKEISVPMIASGGFGKLQDLEMAYENGADAVAIADAFHFDKLTIDDVRNHLIKSNIDTRRDSNV